jgi:ABC-2 type transport system permease protein
LVVVAAFTTLLGGIAVFNNQFGTDGAAYWLHVAVDGGARDDLTGKNLAALALGLPIPIVSAVILAAATGGWSYLPFTFVVGFGVLGVLLGVGNVVSVRFPQPLPESRANMWATRSGQGCAIAIISLLVIAGECLILLPAMIGTFLATTSVPALKPSVAIGTVLYGWGLWWVGRNVAARWLEAHQPEMLERLSPRQA